MRPNRSVRPGPRLILFFLFLAASLFPSAASAEELPTGSVVEKVVCKGDAGKSYALYLPSNYTPQKRWPILYVFEPAARGRLAVELFKDAAERYGYIVVGSNDSRNGPGVPLAEIISALWDDTHARFPVDERRTYAAGFSGGARVAFAFAHAYRGLVGGVIACSGGLPSRLGPEIRVLPPVFETAGTDDFNAAEMIAVGAALEEAGVPHRLEFFEGGHDWLPRPLAVRAVEWLELLAMKSARRERDARFVEALAGRAAEEGRRAESSGDLLKALADYRMLAEDFKGLTETAEFEKKYSAFRDSKEVREALRREREQAQAQERLSRQLYAYGVMSADPDERVNAGAKLRQTVGDLRRKAQGDADTPERRVARRVLYGYHAGLFEEAAALTYRKDYAAAAARLEWAAEVRPEDPSPLYVLARVYTLDGKKKKALAALDGAARRGFTNFALMERDETLAPLRGEPEFQRLVETLKAKSGASK